MHMQDLCKTLNNNLTIFLKTSLNTYSHIAWASRLGKSANY